uniref:RanBP2-type domain-containing protein n=1 Tax=Biomphalaria glabrata TaxID=6526 RepID=A0A2C9LJK5_BIOGL
MTMSFNAEHTTNNLDSLDIESPFSSLDSELNTSLELSRKLSEEKEKNRKLQEKLAGYKTVVQQVPKYQSQLKDLQLKYEETIKQLKPQQKQENLIQPSSEQTETQGLTELANPISTHSPVNTRSPSFVVLYPPGEGGHDNGRPVKEKHTSPVTVSTSLFKSVTGSQETELPKGFQSKLDISQLNPLKDQNKQSKPEEAYVKSSRGSVEPYFVISGTHTIYTPVDVLRPHSTPTIYRPVPISTFEMSNISSPSVKDFTGLVNFPAQATGPPVHSFGIGAKPKEWAPLNFSNQKRYQFEQEQMAALENLTAAPRNISVKLQPVPNISPPGTSSELSQLGVNLNPPVIPSELSHTNPPGPTVFSQKSQDLSQNNTKLTGTSDQNILDMASDLMKFSTVVLPPHEQSELNPLAFSDKAKGVTFPSDDHHQLSSQAESMAAILKSSHPPSGISEMLLEFSKEVGKLEAQLQEKEAQIQRLQVHLQSSAKNGSDRELSHLREENKSLREENENLFAMIKTHSDTHNQSVPQNEFRWLTVTSQTSGDSNKSTQPESPLMRKIDTLEQINTKLFLANKDWYNKWEILRQSNNEKIEEMESKLESLKKENERLAEVNGDLKNKLAVEKITQDQMLKSMIVLEGEKSNLQKFVASLKQDVDMLTQEKRKLAAEVTMLTNASKQKSKEEAGSKAMEVEMTLLKQQLTVYSEDFEKERQDRAAAESKADKMRKERDRIKATSDAKIKQLNSQFKNLEDTLRTKNRQVADLQVQIEDLKLQLHSSQRKATLAPQHSYNYPIPASYGPTTHLFPSSGVESSVPVAALPIASGTFPKQVNRPLRTGPGPPGAGPEYLAGAWTCKECTYINYPSRSVCDICGYRNIADTESLAYETGGQELQSRGDNVMLGFRDIETDTQPKWQSESRNI